MLELHGYWIEAALAIPVLASIIVGSLRNHRLRWGITVLAMGITLLCAVVAWLDFESLKSFEAHDRSNIWERWLGSEVLVIDELSAPLFAFGALLYFAVTFVTPRSKQSRFPFALTLVSLSLLLALLSCREPRWFVGLLLLQNLLPIFELRARGQVWQLFALHQLLSMALIAVGSWMAWSASDVIARPFVGDVLLALGLVIRCGCVPFHTWMIDLFERATLGTAILFVVPMVGALGVVRLVFPFTSAEILRAIALVSLFSAIYASGMAVVQTNTRKFFAYLVLGNGSLVLIGLESVTTIGLTGGLILWFSSGISLTALGIVIRAVEGRVGRVGLDNFHGLYGQMPGLAGFFLLAVLSGIGFPGTIGFIGGELLVEGAIHVYSFVGALVVVVMAFNGIGALRAYFRLFTGSIAPATISMQPSLPERLTIVTLALLMILGGLFPQWQASSRYHAAQELLRRRAATSPRDAKEAVNTNLTNATRNSTHD